MEPMGIWLRKCGTNARVVELHTCLIMCLEHWRATDELGELWSVERELIEERDMQVIESRSIDPCHEVL